jgi:hypothetical protein
MLEQKTQWIGTRFGDIDEKILGQIEKVSDISWPDLVKEYEVNGHTLRYQMVRDIEKSAERIAEIYRNGINEMVGNCEYEWHHNPEDIISKVRTGDWNFYGCYLEGKLIAVESMYIIRGQRALQWVWGCVDPIFRGKGVWRHIGEYNDILVQMSGAQMGIVWVVTTHKYSQMTAEKAGYRPMGCFVGGEFLGGSDNRYFRQTVIWYGKLYGDGNRHLQDWGTMELTESAGKLVKAVQELWADDT